MTKNALWLAIAASMLSVSGCSELRAQGKPKPAYGEPLTTAQVCDTHADCEITVTIDTHQVPCKAIVTPEINWVYKVQDVRLVWKLDAPDHYKFVALRFKDEDERYRMQFASRLTIASKDQFHGRKMSARQVEVHDRNTKDGSWYYEVAVSNGTTTCKVDPPVVNG
jgi:hypothetical protein